MSLPDWANREKCKGELAACGRGFAVSLYIFFGCLLLGIISDAADITLGLEAMSWFLLAIAFVLAAIFFRIGWAVAWYLNINK
jgi:hypothetical protein